jgi:hypothetical protein
MNTETFYNAWESSPVESFLPVDQASKGFIKDGPMSSPSFGVRPSQYAPSSAFNAIMADETLFASIVTKVDAVVGTGIKVSHPLNERKEKAVNNLFERININSFLRQLCYSLFAYGNVFVEIASGPSGKELYVLETPEMEIVDLEGHGEVDGYIQRNTRGAVHFTPEEIVHIKFDSFSTALWAEIPIRPLDQLIAIKMEVKNHLWAMFHDNAFRETIHFPSKTTKDDVDRSLSEYKATQRDRKKPYLWFGDGVEHSFLMDFSDGPRFQSLINMIDMRILSSQQVPPIMAGYADDSGRASGEQQTYKAFNTHIRAVQRLIEHYFNNELFPKAGLAGAIMSFAELDNKSEKDVIEMAERLKNMGAKPDKLVNWLNTQGFHLEDDFFNEPEEAPSNSVSDDLFPSRRPLGEGEINERVGTASEGESREDQLVTQAFGRLTDRRVRERAKKLLSEGLFYE